MVFSKTFPKTVPGSNYPVWEEVVLTSEEEKEAEEKCQKRNNLLLDQCIQEAENLAIKNGINQEDVVAALAVALFEKRASHEVFWKENKAKEKFEAMHQ